MRILFLTSYFRSGQTTHVFSLARALHRQGHSVHVVNGRARTPRQLQYTRALADGLPFSTSLNLPRLVRFVRTRGCDVIHAHSKRTFLLGARLARITGVPLVITCHALTLIRRKFNPAFHRARYIICPWPELAEHLGRRGGRTVVNPNGIELDRFSLRQRTPARVLRVLYLGRIDQVRQPGVEALCQAVTGLNGVKLSLATDRRIPCPAGQYLGWLSHPEKTLAESDVVIGTGRAVLEGMAMGCAALVLGDGWDGLLTPDNAATLSHCNFIGRATGTPPAVSSLRGTLARLRGDPELRARLARWGPAYVAQHYDVNDVANRTLAIYQAARSKRRALRRRGS